VVVGVAAAAVMVVVQQVKQEQWVSFDVYEVSQ
jgi:hypothetical protein